MSPQRITNTIRRDVTLLHVDDCLRDAVHAVIESGAPALPVVDRAGELRGIFGAHEFIAAVFPGYLNALGSAVFVKRSLDEALEKRAGCADEPVGAHMNNDHVAASEDVSDMQLAEVFLHHHVLIVPIVDDGRVTGVVTREAFFRALAERVLPRSG